MFHSHRFLLANIISCYYERAERAIKRNAVQFTSIIDDVVNSSSSQTQVVRVRPIGC